MDPESTWNSLFQSIDRIQAPQGSKLQHLNADLENQAYQLVDPQALIRWTNPNIKSSVPSNSLVLICMLEPIHGHECTFQKLDTQFHLEW